MKTYSDDAVTKSDIDDMERKYSLRMGDTDAKQSRQILQLRVLVGASLLANAALLAAVCMRWIP
jgi:hypothetical protein